MQNVADFNADLYKEIVSELPDGVLVIASGGEIVMFNQKAEVLLGLSPNDTGRLFVEVFPDRGDEYGNFAALMPEILRRCMGSSETLSEISADYINDSGKKFKLLLTADILNSGGERAMSVLIKDITDSSSQSRFLSKMSHEFRTPINAILGMNEMILRECSDEQILEYAEYIQSSGKSLLFLMNDILDMAKIESGRLEINPMEYTTADFLLELWNTVYLRAKEKNLSLSFVVDKSMPKTLFGDVIRLKQITSNILSNAILRSEKGGVELDIACQCADDKNASLIISVKDHGGDFSPDDFNMFKSDSSYGLHISMELIRLMGGSIDTKKNSPQGLIFTACVPQTVIDSQYMGDFEAIRHEHSYSPQSGGLHISKSQNARVLVVDDNIMNITVFKALLKNTGLDIVSAESGKVCLEIAKEQQFDIIFMDHMMPEMDGIETLHQLRDMADCPNKDTPVIALTANALSGAKEFYLNEGFSDFLAKPIDSKQLEEMITRYLADERSGFSLSEDFQASETSDVSSGANNEDGADSYADYEEYGISIADGLGYSGDSMDVYLELMDMFLNNVSKQAMMEQLIVDCDIKNYSIEVHGLKGNARMLGANRLADIAYEHEKQGKAGNLEYVEEHWDELIAVWNETLEGFGEFYRSQTGAADDEIVADDGECFEISQDDMTEVANLITNFETSKAVQQLSDWLKKPLKQEVRKRLKDAFNALDKEYDEDKAIEILSSN